MQRRKAFIIIMILAVSILGISILINDSRPNLQMALCKKDTVPTIRTGISAVIEGSIFAFAICGLDTEDHYALYDTYKGKLWQAWNGTTEHVVYVTVHEDDYNNKEGFIKFYVWSLDSVGIVASIIIHMKQITQFLEN